MVSWNSALLTHIWWRNNITNHLGLEQKMEGGSCDWCPWQNYERSLDPGCQESESQTSRVKRKDGIWLSETFGSNFSPTWQREAETDVAESAAIKHSPRGEPGAVLMMLGRSCTSRRSGCILPDSAEDMQPGPLLWMPMARHDTKAMARVFVSLYSYLWNQLQICRRLAWWCSGLEQHFARDRYLQRVLVPLNVSPGKLLPLTIQKHGWFAD